jgi:uncharacterized RDD family membrane protein YckC
MRRGDGVICPSCGSELSASASICQACGARRDPGDWHDRVRESVQRHRDRKLSQQQKTDEERQLTIFPQEVFVDPATQAVRERRAEIRARVEERLTRKAISARSQRESGRTIDAGEIPLGRRNALAAARDLAPEPEPDPPREDELPDPRADRYIPVPEPVALRMPFTEAESDDPAEPVLELGVASGFERVIAGAIDLVFVGLIQLTLFYLTTHLVAQRAGALPRSALVAMGLVGAVMAASYFLFFWSLSGQTLGKLLTGSRVVDRRGRALGFGRAAMRLAAMFVAALPLGAGFIGLWTDPERRGWHDRIAGTKVIRG